MEDKEARRKRKQEAKLLKRKRIEEAGGVRPRPEKKEAAVASASSKHGTSRNNRPKNVSTKKRQSDGRHRFGQVMEQVPCRNKPRFSTVSIALPGSVVSNCQTRELQTQLVGQIARAAAIYHVDEIIVFDDKLAAPKPRHYNRQFDRINKEGEDRETRTEPERTQKRSDPHTFMARVLQYCECPQYLRRHFFPMHPDLQFAGLLSPIDAPHHVRAGEQSKYREGVVLEKKGTGADAGSLVNCGIRGRPVEIDRVLQAGIRCTVQLDEKDYARPGRILGKVVAPSAPREDNGTYWGFSTRLASSIKAVFDECPFDGGYDLKVGTSERGTSTVDDHAFSLPEYKHSLVVFGGVAGIEECVDADESMKLPGSLSKSLFNLWVNTCPFQGSRTIRTEEAVLISLARLSPFLTASTGKQENSEHESDSEATQPSLHLSDDEPSEESSDDSSKDS